MAGFFRKVAGAFVEFPEEGPPEAPRRPGTPAAAPPAPPAGSKPAPVSSAADIDQLLAAIDGKGGRPAPAAATPPPPPPPARPAPASDKPLLSLTPDEVFAAAGVADTPNSANRLLKMLQGLAAFPVEQQLAMVRALDAADSSWTESGVLSDARSRQQALRTHLDRLEREHARRGADLAAKARDTQAHADGVLADIDRQIADLQRLRQEALAETAGLLAGIDRERQDLDQQLAAAKKTTTALSDDLSKLISFFAGAARPHAG